MVFVTLVLAILAVARLTRLIKDDQVTLFFRRWVVNRWGEDSNPAYLVHCAWCLSMWLGFLVMVPWAVLSLPAQQWWVAVLGALAASYITGLLSQIEER